LAAFLEINFVQDVRSDALALCRALNNAQEERSWQMLFMECSVSLHESCMARLIYFYVRKVVNASDSVQE
jgi:hypothetical protein